MGEKNKGETIGQRIYFLRNKYGISQQDFAAAVGISIDMVKKYEKEILKQIPSYEVEKMASVLHTTAPYLYYGDAGVFHYNIAREHMDNEENLFDEPFDDLDLYEEMNALTPEERDKIIASGAFNKHIEGYMVLVLRKIGYPESEINSIRGVLSREVFDHVTAATARETGRLLGVVVKPPKGSSNVIAHPFLR